MLHGVEISLQLSFTEYIQKESGFVLRWRLDTIIFFPERKLLFSILIGKVSLVDLKKNILFLKFLMRPY